MSFTRNANASNSHEEDAETVFDYSGLTIAAGANIAVIVECSFSANPGVTDWNVGRTVTHRIYLGVQCDRPLR
jgi:hypothetical protein